VSDESKENEFRDRMTTLGEMAAVLAHEIKNPMNSIIINMEVLKGAVQDMASKTQAANSEKVLRYFEIINDEIRRLDKVIKGFLDLAAPPQPTKVLFSLNQLLQKTAEFIKEEFSKKGISFDYRLQEDLPRLLGSSDQIRQALLNLLINSSQAMPDGGSIILETGYNEKTLYLKVQDSGGGIPESIKAKVFSPYFTTKEKGSGLGLAIVRRIVREHGGYVELQSEVGKGSTFQIVFLRSGAEK